MDINYVGFQNEDEIEIIKEHIEEIKQFFPFWVGEVLFVKQQSDSDDSDEVTILQINMLPEYRKVDIDIFPVFFGYENDKQKFLLLHELVHTILGRLSNWVDRQLKTKHQKEEFKERLESTTQEFTYILRKKYEI